MYLAETLYADSNFRKKTKKKKKILIKIFKIKKFRRILFDLQCYNSVFYPLFSKFYFFSKRLKITHYLYFMRKHLIGNITYDKKNFILQIRKKKRYYFIYLILNNKIVLMTSLGIILRYLGIQAKSLKKSRKAFNILINILEKIYFNFLGKPFYKTFILDFLDKNIFHFHDKISKLIKKSYFFLINLNINFGKSSFKKYKSIKKRFRKKNLIKFLTDLKTFSFPEISKQNLWVKTLAKNKLKKN